MEKYLSLDRASLCIFDYLLSSLSTLYHFVHTLALFFHNMIVKIFFFFFWRFQSPIFTSTCSTVGSPKLLPLPHHFIGIKQNWQRSPSTSGFSLHRLEYSAALSLVILFLLFCFVFCRWLRTKVQGQTQISSLSIQRRWFQPTSWLCMGVAVAWRLSESCIFIATRVTFASQALKSLLLYG